MIAIPIRHVLIVVIVLGMLFVTFRITSNNHLLTREMLSSLTHSLSSSDDSLPLVHTTPSITLDSSQRANATFVILCRNSDLDGVIHSVRSIEDRFNRQHEYPYVFLNEEPFNDEFQRRISVLSAAPMEFGVIPHDHWYAPESIDEEKAANGRKKMEEDNIIYGGSVSYRNMCRFNSGAFIASEVQVRGLPLSIQALSPSLNDVDRYYWRIEPWVHFHCDIPSDPFQFMISHNKTYSFTISMYEYQATIVSLWDTVKEYTKAHPETLDPQNSMGFISDDSGHSYNLCHFWSNFEIADMDFWRSETYMSFFEFLDSTGGFYYERWGDAPVHSIAAALFLPRSAIHFFSDIGYEHPPYTHCPINAHQWANNRCSCNPDGNFDYDGYSCLRKWDALLDQ